MTVKLVSYTQPAQELEHEGIHSKDLVAYIARVSNPDNQMNTATADKLIAYLIKNKHWSPLQFVDVTFEIETTRDISRQMIRHQSFDFQEFSGRYSEMYGYKFSECRLQDATNRQKSLPCLDTDLQEWWEKQQWFVSATCHDIYKDALKKGIAKEVARKILPEGLTKTKLYMKGSIRSWIHYLEVRDYEGAQYDHREIAQQIAGVMKETYPSVFSTQHQ